MLMNTDDTRKLAIICSKGTLDMAYPGLILANAARMLGIDVMIFFTFWGMDIITQGKVDHLKVSPVSTPSMGMPTMVAGLPGMTGLATTMMKHQIEALDVPPVHEFLTMIHDAGAKLYACKMSVDMMKLADDDFVDEVDEVIGAMEMLELSEGAQLLFI
jgi:peroxiredoxin family protein